MCKHLSAAAMAWGLLLVSGFLAPAADDITGSVPDPAGDTVIDRDTVWKGKRIALGRNLIVKSGRSLSIEECEVVFKGVWPEGQLSCENGATLVIKDCCIHGTGEKEYAERAAGLELGEENDTLTVKISGTTFKYLGDGWSKKKVPGMVHAKAIYTPDSYFKGNSFICDSIPGLRGPAPIGAPAEKNWVWGFVGPRDSADAKPEHGIAVEDCFFYQNNVGVFHNRYLSGSAFLKCGNVMDTPIHHYVYQGNWFEDSTHKPYNPFPPSHHGLTRDNYFRNTAICFTTGRIGQTSHQVFRNNIIVTADSARFAKWLCWRGAGGHGNDAMFIGNDIISCRQHGILSSGGKDWVIAGNRFTGPCGLGFGTQIFPDLTNPAERARIKDYPAWRRKIVQNVEDAKHGTLIIGNRFDNCGTGISAGVGGWRGRFPTSWKDLVAAGNEITNCKTGIKLFKTIHAVVKSNKIQGCETGMDIGLDVTLCNVSANEMSENTADIKGSGSGSEEFPAARIISPAGNDFKKGQPVTFKGEGRPKGNKKIASYWWFFGDGTMSDEQNPSHTFARDDKYFVALLVTDSDGLRDIAIMPGKIDAVWNQSQDPKRPWPEREPQLRAFPNPLYVGTIQTAAFVPFYYMGEVKVRVEDQTGKPIRVLDGSKFEYPGILEWDLKDSNREHVSPGEYVGIALDEEGEEVSRCRLNIVHGKP